MMSTIFYVIWGIIQIQNEETGEINFYYFLDQRRKCAYLFENEMMNGVKYIPFHVCSTLYQNDSRRNNLK